jgi:hypothetical protein
MDFRRSKVFIALSLALKRLASQFTKLTDRHQSSMGHDNTGLFKKKFADFYIGGKI